MNFLVKFFRSTTNFAGIGSRPEVFFRVGIAMFLIPFSTTLIGTEFF